MCIRDCNNYTLKIRIYSGGFITRFLNNCYSFNGSHYLYTEKKHGTCKYYRSRMEPHGAAWSCMEPHGAA